jgi:hypothetical protein
MSIQVFKCLISYASHEYHKGEIGIPGQDDDCEEMEENSCKEIDSDDTFEEAEAVLETNQIMKIFIGVNL